MNIEQVKPRTEFDWAAGGSELTGSMVTCSMMTGICVCITHWKNCRYWKLKHGHASKCCSIVMLLQLSAAINKLFFFTTLYLQGAPVKNLHA